MARVLKGGRPAGGEGTPRIDERPFDAKVEAERILADAGREAERLRAQAVTEGRERGMAAVSELLVAARASAARAQRNVQGDLRTLAVRIAERILEREISLNPDAVSDIVAAALRQAGAPRDIVLRVHPDDLKALERGRPRLIERCSRTQAVLFRADATIARGGCIVETELGTVDARLPTQLEAIERALRGQGP
jgi:flagellar biosynthesis/type III secretory pathway protein FliH